MKNNEFKTVDMTAKFSKFEVINSEFTRCRCNVFYTGKNRNYSDITEEALNKFVARKGYANVPVVAHLMKDSDGHYHVGGHDSKLVISDEGFEIINECVPFGVIPEDCNPSMDIITERSGEKRKYFSVDIILWTHRYPIMEAAFSDEIYFNQSMELTYEDISYDGDYIVVNDFSMSALCLLNRSLNSNENVEPCFESSRVKKFSLDESEFKKNYELLLDNLKKISDDKNKFQIKKKEENSMDFSKVTEALAQYTFKNADDTDIAKYALLTVGETSIGVIDREDYCTYSIDCTEADGAIVFDMDSKTKCAMGVKDYVEGESFDLAGEIESVKEATKTTYEAELSKSYATEYNAKIDEITQAYADLKANFDTMSAELEKYKKADTDRKTAEHKAEIDTLIETYAKKIGRLPKFLCYRAKLDYSKETADVERELTVMAGEAMMDKGTANFSYSPVITPVGKVSTEKYAGSDRYGNLLDKYMND